VRKPDKVDTIKKGKFHKFHTIKKGKQKNNKERTTMLRFAKDLNLTKPNIRVLKKTLFETIICIKKA
jgi:hypothetical protein